MKSYSKNMKNSMLYEKLLTKVLEQGMADWFVKKGPKFLRFFKEIFYHSYYR